MENRKNSLSVLKICRFCLSQDDTLACIYDRNIKPKNAICLSLKILSCLSVEVFPSDRLPAYICKPCTFFIELFYKYKDICRKADESIMMHIQGGSTLEQMAWPTLLTKVFRFASKTEPIVNAVVEGATVQVTSQDGSDSEDGDESNVYNVKIGDESGDQGSKRIKVITSSNEEKEKTKTSKEFTAISKLTRHVRTHAGDRSYPCKYCDKTFIKSHHYTRHLRLKHRADRQPGWRTANQPSEQYRCEQCSETFESQDELIYHSAIHATQNLTCPLCQEKFVDVDAVTAHIKSHVNGIEFMCDLCELVFTSKEKLDKHLNAAHAEELDQDESSIEGEEEDDDDTGINVTEEDGEMVVEIKKTDNFVLPEAQTSTDEKPVNTMFDENETEITYTELATVDTLAMAKKDTIKIETDVSIVPMIVSTTTLAKVPSKSVEPADVQTAPILRKAEEVKRKVQQITEPLPEKKEKVAKAESSNSVGASDKSLRLLEKELQELKRTNTRNEVAKTPVKSMEGLRNRRPQLHTSTPKPRTVEQKKELPSSKTPAAERKVFERRIVVTKENKEPKETKDTKANATPVKEEKNAKDKEEKKEEVKEKDTPKSVVKNGANEKSQPEENVRRSTRPSKIKDYAKMIRDKSQESDEDSDDAEDEEYREVEKTETRAKTRRISIKTPTGKAAPPAPAASPAASTPGPRKRGRPRKDLPKEVPAKMRKDDPEEDEEEKETDKNEAEQTVKKSTTPVGKESETDDNSEKPEPMDTATTANDANKSSSDQKASPPGGNLLMSPTGQTLKKVPIRALPPGIKPLPLPVHARPMGPGELCEMQIGKKVVKVQKIVMTKAEVEAMAKKGLVEMKDGTMVLKQGIKLPTSDLSLSSLVPTLGDKGASKTPKTEKASNTQSNASE